MGYPLGWFHHAFSALSVPNVSISTLISPETWRTKHEAGRIKPWSHSARLGCTDRDSAKMSQRMEDLRGFGPNQCSWTVHSFARNELRPIRRPDPPGAGHRGEPPEHSADRTWPRIEHWSF